MMNNAKRLALVLGASLSLVGCSVSPVIYNHVQEAWTSASQNISRPGYGTDYWKWLNGKVDDLNDSLPYSYGNTYYCNRYDPDTGGVYLANESFYEHQLWARSSDAGNTLYYVMGFNANEVGVPYYTDYTYFSDGFAYGLRQYMCFGFTLVQGSDSASLAATNVGYAKYFDYSATFSITYSNGDSTTEYVNEYTVTSANPGAIYSTSATYNSSGYKIFYIDLKRIEVYPHLNIDSIASSAYESGYDAGSSAGFSNGYSSGYAQASNDGLANVEVIDMWSLFSTIITMPFTFVQQGFNFTIFEGTSYEFNAGMFLGSVLVILMIWKILQLVFKFGK